MKIFLILMTIFVLTTLLDSCLMLPDRGQGSDTKATLTFNYDQDVKADDK